MEVFVTACLSLLFGLVLGRTLEAWRHKEVREGAFVARLFAEIEAAQQEAPLEAPCLDELTEDETEEPEEDEPEDDSLGFVTLKFFAEGAIANFNFSIKQNDIVVASLRALADRFDAEDQQRPTVH